MRLRMAVGFLRTIHVGVVLRCYRSVPVNLRVMTFGRPSYGLIDSGWLAVILLDVM